MKYLVTIRPPEFVCLFSVSFRENLKLAITSALILRFNNRVTVSVWHI
jgi:hypothetical protein